MLAGHTNTVRKKAFSIIELLLALTIVSLLLFITTKNISQYFYYHRANLFTNKLQNILNFARNSAVISQQSVMVYPLDNNWHNPIIISYSSDNKVLLKIYQFITPSENIVLNSVLKNTENSSVIVFNPLGHTPTNGTLKYSNMYYTKFIKLNKTGRLSIK
ncbi:MAG: GspH/FimT family protein [Gammaproteobacteria bacterium]|nr:GspH/FimT family protein [Gammaproteobacteria bacterium]